MGFKSFFHPGRIIERFDEYKYFTQFEFESLCRLLEAIHARELEIDEVRIQNTAKIDVMAQLLARTDLPDDPDRAERIVTEGHRLWYRSLVALCCKLGDPRMLDEIIAIEGQERLDEVKERWGACVLVTPHYGPHLALPFLLVKAGLQMHFTGFVSDNYIESCKAIATFHGLDFGDADGLSVNEGFAIQAVKALTSGRSLCIYPEYSHSKRLGRYSTQFLGRTVHTPTGPARLAGAAGRPILTCVLRPVEVEGEPWRFRLCFETIIPPESLKGEEALAEVTRQIFAEVEGWVREHPEAWEGWHYFETMEKNGALAVTQRMFRS